MENSSKEKGPDNGDQSLEQSKEPMLQNKPDPIRVPTVTPDNDNAGPGPAAEENSSNKGQGPAGENL